MTQIPPPQDPAYKLAALQALATGGTRAKAALDETKAQMDASRTQALQGAINGARQLNVSQAGQDELSAIINRPFVSAQALLNSRGAADQAALAAPRDALSRVFDTKYAAGVDKIQKAAAKAASSGGGGGGGKSSSTDWWNSDLQDQFDTKANLYAAIRQQAAEDTSMPLYKSAAKIAAQYGIPAGAITAQFKPSQTYNDWSAVFAPDQIRTTAKIPPKKFKTELAASGLDAGSQQYFLNQYNAAQPHGGGGIGSKLGKKKK